MKVFSSGGGVQSTAAQVLAAQGKIDYRVFLFANVGDDSENPDSLAYVHDVLIPHAAAHGLEFHELRRQTNNSETLLQKTRHEHRSIKIPVRMKNGAPGARSCTQDFKRAVIRQRLGAGEHVVGLGISRVAIGRMRTDSGYKNIVNEYPLIDLRLRRTDCLRIVAEAGLPTPPKSACWFCPFHNQAAWHDLRLKHPGLFAAAVELERELTAKRAALGRDPVYLTPKGQPLDVAIGDQLAFEGLDNCESGYCMV